MIIYYYICFNRSIPGTSCVAKKCRFTKQHNFLPFGCGNAVSKILCRFIPCHLRLGRAAIDLMIQRGFSFTCNVLVLNPTIAMSSKYLTVLEFEL